MDNEDIIETCRRFVRSNIEEGVGPYKYKVDNFNYEGKDNGYLIGIVTRSITPAIKIKQQSINGRYGEVNQKKVDRFNSYSAATAAMETAVNKQNEDLSSYHNEIYSASTDDPEKAFQFVNGEEMSLQPSHACIGIENCKICTGKGDVNCSPCGGKGKVSCGKCSGKGKVQESYREEVSEKCSYCFGLRHIPGDQPNTSITCGYCTGRGYRMVMEQKSQWVACNTCNSSGEVSCGTCDASGKVTCNDCKGHGEQSFRYDMVAVYSHSSKFTIAEDKAISTPLCHQMSTYIENERINPDEVYFEHIASNDILYESKVKRVCYYMITDVEIDKGENGKSLISFVGGSNSEPTITHSDDAILDKTLNFLIDSNNESSLDKLIEYMDGIEKLPAITQQKNLKLLSSSFISKAKSIKIKLEEAVISEGRSQQAKKWPFSFVFILFIFSLMISELPSGVLFEFNHQFQLGFAAFSALVAAWVSATCINKGAVTVGNAPPMNSRKIKATITAIIISILTFIVLGPDQIDKSIAISENVRTISFYILVTGFSGLFSYLIQGKISSHKCMTILNKYKNILGS